MKLLVLGSLVLLAACTTAPVDPMGPPAPQTEKVESKSGEKQNWMCHAIASDGEVRAHGEGHNGTCLGTEDCAKEEALKECKRYHKECEITFCTT